MTPEPAAGSCAGLFVQVGSVGSLDNARRVSGRLDEDGRTVRMAEKDREDRLRYRVQVGPVDTRSAAEAMAQRLAEDHDLPGYIVEP